MRCFTLEHRLWAAAHLCGCFSQTLKAMSETWNVLNKCFFDGVQSQDHIRQMREETRFYVHRALSLLQHLWLKPLLSAFISFFKEDNLFAPNILF